MHIHLSELPKVEDKECWVFGKGPSLDYVDWKECGPYRIAINDSPKVVVEPTFAITTDPFDHMFPYAPEFPIVSSKVSLMPFGIPGNEAKVLHPPEAWGRKGLWTTFDPLLPSVWKSHLNWTREEFLKQEKALKSVATVSAAVFLAWALGADTVHTWGIDGGEGRASKFGTEYTPRAGHYDRAFAVVRKICKLKNIKLIQHKPQ